MTLHVACGFDHNMLYAGIVHATSIAHHASKQRPVTLHLLHRDLGLQLAPLLSRLKHDGFTYALYDLNAHDLPQLPTGSDAYP